MLRPVIVLDDVAHRPNSREVLVDALRTDVMQGLRRPGVPIRAGEVDGHLEGKNTWMHVVYMHSPCALDVILIWGF